MRRTCQLAGVLQEGAHRAAARAPAPGTATPSKAGEREREAESIGCRKQGVETNGYTKDDKRSQRGSPEHDQERCRRCSRTPRTTMSVERSLTKRHGRAPRGRILLASPRQLHRREAAVSRGRPCLAYSVYQRTSVLVYHSSTALYCSAHFLSPRQRRGVGPAYPFSMSPSSWSRSRRGASGTLQPQGTARCGSRTSAASLRAAQGAQPAPGRKAEQKECEESGCTTVSEGRVADCLLVF